MEPRCETQVQEIAKNDENKKAQKRYTFPPPPSSLFPIPYYLSYTIQK